MKFARDFFIFQKFFIYFHIINSILYFNTHAFCLSDVYFCIYTNGSKTIKCYDHLFQYINNNIFNLNAKNFMTDNKTALQISLKKIFPEAIVNGCWFHFCQSIRRNIARSFKPLVEFIRGNRKSSQIYHKIVYLPLLPPRTIPATFLVLCEELQSFDQENKFQQFLNYFQKQWINKVIK